ncbi:MAG: photosynthetic complex putative assembly protein PuhB [Congregibacter sp.]
MSVSEHEDEPARGLPGLLPDGEVLVWQGSPDRKVLARRVFHLRTASIYLAALITIHVGLQLSAGEALTTVLLGSTWMFLLAFAALGILAGLAWAYARSTIYTVTNKRLVLRCGVAMQMMVNVPLTTINSADLRRFADGSGDIIFTMDKSKRLSYLLLWPSVKSWQFRPVQPALRSLADIDTVAAAIARVTQSGQEEEELSAAPPSMPSEQTQASTQANGRNSASKQQTNRGSSHRLASRPMYSAS